MEIRRARKAAKMSQDELAKQIGVNRATLSKYENGQIEPSISQLEKIAEVLDVSLFNLLPTEYHSPLKAGFEMGYWEREVEFHAEVDFAIEELERRRDDPQYLRMLIAYGALNNDGQKRVVEYAEALSTTGNYMPPRPPQPIALAGKRGGVSEINKPPQVDDAPNQSSIPAEDKEVIHELIEKMTVMRNNYQ